MKFLIRSASGNTVREFTWEADFLPTIGSAINTYEAFDDPGDADDDDAAYHFCDVTDIKWSLANGRVIPTVVLQPHDPHRKT